MDCGKERKKNTFLLISQFGVSRGNAACPQASDIIFLHSPVLCKNFFSYNPLTFLAPQVSDTGLRDLVQKTKQIPE